MENLEEFLFAHCQHELRFVNDSGDCYVRYNELESIDAIADSGRSTNEKRILAEEEYRKAPRLQPGVFCMHNTEMAICEICKDI
jgi:hypothetical protein